MTTGEATVRTPPRVSTRSTQDAILRLGSNINVFFCVTALVMASRNRFYLLVHFDPVEVEVRVCKRARVIVDKVYKQNPVRHTLMCTRRRRTYQRRFRGIQNFHRQRRPSHRLKPTKISLILERNGQRAWAPPRELRLTERQVDDDVRGAKFATDVALGIWEVSSRSPPGVRVNRAGTV